jgi:hypothetical protein
MVSPCILRVSVSPWWIFFFLLPAGCHTPDAANIELRKQNQQLQSSVDDLTAQHNRDAAALAAAEGARPTVPTLPPDRLDRLFTTHGLEFGRLTGGDNPDTVTGPDTMLKVYVVPIDGQGTPIKAAGAFTVEAFDLGTPSHPLVGTWRFPLERTRDLFFNRFALYTYVLECPWQTVPAHPDLTVKVTFDDELTGRRFTDQTQVKVHPAATTLP